MCVRNTAGVFSEGGVAGEARVTGVQVFVIQWRESLLPSKFFSDIMILLYSLYCVAVLLNHCNMYSRK